MAYRQHQHNMSATFVPGMDDFYMPPAAPELVAPKPNRYGRIVEQDAVYTASREAQKMEC